MDHLPCPSISHTSDVRAEWNPVVLDITDSLGGKKLVGKEELLVTLTESVY